MKISEIWPWGTGLSNDLIMENKSSNELFFFSIWSDVMGELRRGIQLKKVTFSKTPSEFGLTPYEMLMSDIRKRVKLNPTKIPPKVKTDAKDIILEFIRSRPPLKKASNRKLAPRVKDTTPMEDLLEVNISLKHFLPLDNLALLASTYFNGHPGAKLCFRNI